MASAASDTRALSAAATPGSSGLPVDAGYGVRDEHYGTVAVALLSTLALGLGDAFTDEVREAWATVYWVLADTMKAGAADGLLAKSA